MLVLSVAEVAEFGLGLGPLSQIEWLGNSTCFLQFSQFAALLEIFTVFNISGIGVAAPARYPSLQGRDSDTRNIKDSEDFQEYPVQLYAKGNMTPDYVKNALFIPCFDLHLRQCPIIVPMNPAPSPPSSGFSCQSTVTTR